MPDRQPSHLIAAALVAATVLGLPRTAAGQRITGRVTAEPAGGAVAEATVTLLDSAATAVLAAATDSTGAFELGVPRAGEYALRVERLGYATFTSEPLTVRAGERIEVAIALGVAAVPLRPLTVVARRRVLRSPFYDRLERGRRTGQGHFVTRSELEAGAGLRLGTILARIPRLPITYDAAGKARLGRPHRGGVGSVSGQTVRPDETCASRLYLNGVPVPGLQQAVGLDDLAAPEDIEGIEVYRSMPEVPIDYATPGTCIVVAIWSRTGGGRGRGGWVRTLIGGGVVLGLASLLLFN